MLNNCQLMLSILLMILWCFIRKYEEDEVIFHLRIFLLHVGFSHHLRWYPRVCHLRSFVLNVFRTVLVEKEFDIEDGWILWSWTQIWVVDLMTWFLVVWFDVNFLGGGFKYYVLLPGEMIQFDQHVSIGLKSPTSIGLNAIGNCIEMNWIGLIHCFFVMVSTGRHQKSIFSNIPTKILPGSHVFVGCLCVFPFHTQSHTHVAVMFFGCQGTNEYCRLDQLPEEGDEASWNPLMGVDGWLGWWCGKTPWRYGCCLKW